MARPVDREQAPVSQEDWTKQAEESLALVEEAFRRASELHLNAELIASVNAASPAFARAVIRSMKAPAEAALALAQQSLELSQQALDEARDQVNAAAPSKARRSVQLDDELDPVAWSKHDEVELSDDQLEAVQGLARRQQRERSGAATATRRKSAARKAPSRKSASRPKAPTRSRSTKVKSGRG